MAVLVFQYSVTVATCTSTACRIHPRGVPVVHGGAAVEWSGRAVECIWRRVKRDGRVDGHGEGTYLPTYLPCRVGRPHLGERELAWRIVFTPFVPDLNDSWAYYEHAATNTEHRGLAGPPDVFLAQRMLCRSTQRVRKVGRIPRRTGRFVCSRASCVCESIPCRFCSNEMVLVRRRRRRRRRRPCSATVFTAELVGGKFA